MGTFRTNKLHVSAILKLNGWEEREDYIAIKAVRTDVCAVEAPLHGEFVWCLGENHSEVASGDEIPKSQFDDKPLYKVGVYNGEPYLLIMNLTEDSVVYCGGGAGPGLYFETDLREALGYVTYRPNRSKCGTLTRYNTPTAPLLEAAPAVSDEVVECVHMKNA